MVRKSPNGVKDFGVITGGLTMTVGELIKALKEFDEEKEVYYDHLGLSIEDVTEDGNGVYIE